jgi:gliding motility-associated-like protein
MRIEECKCELHIPDGFSPNNDHLNDVFKPVINCALSDYTFTIYDRYGRVAFRTNEVQQGWKGTFGASNAPTGLYVWQLRYKNPNNQQPVIKNGTVFLVR